ncbi:DNA excision repair protein ERCC-6-like 2 isoform X4 [Alligator sinensis]|uniref:DNA excision repair protein ERCC-6-like 2 isoform X4 n=1 Tax=Alligator sinensis TaxID=38654 RepID=A0A3Q0G1E1_ALLSI|nr:DNA excision repair protein ERCC-6-like 2 isoform X4 [Alligator sinensis]
MCEDIVDRWHVGEKCLAPFPESGKLCEATIKSIEKDKNGKSFALVSFLDSEEKRILITKLYKVKTDHGKSLIFDDDDLEKPYFPDRRLPSPAVAFELSKNGDCIPYTINRYLRDYQREGVQFLYGHYAHKRGCILGDDMGLGKTIQVISFLAAVLHKKGTRKDMENNMPDFLLRTVKKEPKCVPKKTFLVVAPLSVLYNWRDELDIWGYFRIGVLHGSQKDNELTRIKQGKCEVVLTTYETLRLCLDELNSVEWSAVIVDEAHRIKNPKAQITKTMKGLKCIVRIGLTGTILQNNMKELWCVMDWAIPGLLGSKVYFKKKFSDPVEHGQRHTATKRELATGRKAMQKLAGKMSGWFLRRTKALISDQLPKKEDRIVYCSLTEFQKAVYQAVLETEDVNLILRAWVPCSCNSGRRRKNCCYKTNFHGETMKALYFSYLTVLRKVANHAALLQTENTSKQQKTHIKRVCNQVFSKFPDFVQLSNDAAFETISDPKYSGKMKVLQQLLNHFRKNRDKVLLFSFSTKLLDVLERYCMASGLDYRRLDGNTKSEDRVKIVREFNSMQDINICLVSTMAGGLGLNFVGANVVILFDPTWNPANDLQAIDRAYRIGQCRDVKVFRLISLGTVEEMMYLRQVYKQQLHCVVVGSENAKRYFEAVQGSKEHKGELFGIRNLFKLRTHGSCLTKDILEREGKVEAGVMTATTWLKEEPPSCKSEMHAEPGYEEDKDPVRPQEQLVKEEFDFSSEGASVTPVKPSHFHSPKTAICKEASARQEEQGGSLDRYFDGVQEVAYIHSNQNVVGSSKAENHMSRWAVRDVFELKQFSQLPANVPVYSDKKDEESPEENPKEAASVKKSTERWQQRGQQRAGKQFHLCITHPIIQKKKKVHRVGSTTFLIGKTPTGIRRKQFEEMVSYFNMASVEELAEHIAKATSEIRQKMLKDFYAAKYPELENIFTIEVPACVSDRCEEDEMCSAHSRKRKSPIKFRKSRSSASAVEDPPHETTEICSQKRHKVETEQVHNNSCIQDGVCLNAEYKQLPTVITQDSISGRNSRAFKDFMASGSLSSKSEIIEVLSANATCRQQDSEGTVSPRKRSLSQSENGEKLFCKKNSFVDLLGDTSILSDLFKSDGNRPTQLPRRFPSEPASKAKERPKDFWDMLNEENDESIGKLTDVAVIKELCERAPLAALTKKEEACESSLWKKNENFLWKKYNATEPVPGTSLDA